MSIGEKIRESLELGSERFREEYKDDPIRFLTEKCGRKYPRKLRRFFEDVYFLRVFLAALKANRGGGKSTVFADLAACLYALRDFDGLIIGGAEVQAKNDYNYAAQVLQIDDRLDDFHSEFLKTLCRSQFGNWLKFAAASTKQVRGPHCGDPHNQMHNDMLPHGGITIIDEECETDEDIVTAVKYTINTAKPGILLRGSTLHKLTGSFAELCEDPGSQGFKLYEWDCFDTAERCKRNCKRCIPEFAGRKMPGWIDWKKRHPEFVHEKGYCEGRAKKDDGWRSIRSIEDSFIMATNLEEFEVEEMGWRSAAGGQVLNPQLLDKCLKGITVFMPGMPTIAMVDWGLRSWAVIHLFQEQANKAKVQIQTEYYHNERDEIIYMRLEAWRKLFGVNIVCPDGSHPYQNENLRYRGFDVREVNFNQWKEYGAGWIKGMLERGLLWLSGEWVELDDGERKKRFADSETERFFGELKGWKRDKNGKIVKKDDHGPDALLCGSIVWGEEKIWKAEFSSYGKRELFAGSGRRF